MSAATSGDSRRAALSAIPHSLRSCGLRGRLPDAAERREQLQQIVARLADETGEEGDAGEHEERSHGLLNRFEMALEAGDQGGTRLDGEGREQKRNAEPGRVDREQH